MSLFKGLKTKVALVTAASKGIGKATAAGLLAEGARVIICARHEEDLEQAKSELAKSGPDVHAVKADVSDPEQLKGLYTCAQEKFGTIDILINNAGGPPPGGHQDLDDEAWKDAFNLTVQSAIRLSNLVLPSMKASGWGRIVNISSYSVRQPMENMMLSNSLRLSVLGWAKTLSNEVAPFGITVNTVCPGWTNTHRVASLLKTRSVTEGITIEDARGMIAKEVPLGRLAEASEIANVAVFLSSEPARYMTGVAVPVDGGISRAI